MTFQIDSSHLDMPASQSLAALNITEDSIVNFLGSEVGPTTTYPRLVTHEAIVIRAMAIADNLDELIMLPRNMIFPLRTKKQPLMRRKVDKIKSTDSAHFGKRKRNQEYEDFEECDQ